MKAVLQYRATPGFCRQIAELESDWLKISVVPESERAAFDHEMRDADVLLHVLERVTQATIDGAPQLRLIQKLGIGVDTIDLDAARRRGIAVCNMPGTNTRAVAELTLLLMLATLRRLTELHVRTREGAGWRLDTDVLDDLGELGGRTVGLVGYGAVGRTLAPWLRAVGATVLYTDVREIADAQATFAPFPGLLSRSDIVSLHLPLTAATAGLMNASAFASMKRGSILINAARGGLVDEGALVDALERRHLRGAGLDVFAHEPLDSDSPLMKLSNVVVTPHLAWFTAETLSRGLGVFAENCERLRDGREFLFRVV
jgi:phosphoglycerate dehydrogenase-like enzyme